MKNIKQQVEAGTRDRLPVFGKRYRDLLSSSVIKGLKQKFQWVSLPKGLKYGMCAPSTQPPLTLSLSTRQTESEVSTCALVSVDNKEPIPVLAARFVQL
jgi:hypothetical protein